MWKFLVKAAVSALLIWLLASRTDISAVANRMLGIGLAGFLLPVLVLLALSLVATLRWTLVIRALGGAMRFPDAWRIVMIGNFFNQALPSNVGGDGIRMWQARGTGLALRRAVNGVLIDRFTALLAICLLIVLTAPLLFGIVGDPAARWGVLAVALAGFAGFGLLLALDRLPGAWFRWRPMQAVGALSADARRVFLAPGPALGVLVPSLLIHAGLAFIVMLIARRLLLPVGYLEFLVLVPPVMLISAIPISIAGWGVREGAMVAGFGFLGLPAADALATSLLFGAVTLAVGLLGAPLWLLGGRPGAAVGRDAARPGPAGDDSGP